MSDLIENRKAKSQSQPRNTPGLKLFLSKGQLEAGVDEAGRGCLAGPVVAAAVILPKKVKLPGLTDSKQLSKLQRERLVPLIKEQALAWAIGIAVVEEIDRINILQATFLAMHRAIEGLNTAPEHLIVDGNRFRPFQGIPHSTIISGDSLYLSIAAASVLAKTYRDSHMLELHLAFPSFGWDQNKGYGTVLHRKAISEHGSTNHHRLSFRLLPEPQLGLF